VLDKFVSGDIKRLIVTMPPRHSKSEFVSRRLPAYILGRNPDAKIIATSYGADLASRMNRDVQRIIDSPEYNRLFPGTNLSGVNNRTISGSYLRNSDIFEIVGRFGSYRSSGIGGGIIGMGFNFGVIDDPFKDRKQANSPAYRNSVYDWFRSVFMTRQEPGAGILITMTRWHEDDLVARLLKLAKEESGADQWEIINFPAIAEQIEYGENEYPTIEDTVPPIGMGSLDPRETGEALWPDRFDEDALESIRIMLGSYEWNALYQQRPKAPEGYRIKRHWFDKVVREVPRDAKFVRYWDKAGTEDGGAYTAGVLMAQYEGFYYIVDVKRAQLSAFERERMIKQATQEQMKYGRVRTYIEQEPGSSGQDSVKMTIANLAGFSVYADRPSGDKDERLYPFEAQAEAGNVRIVKGDWNEAYLDELAAIGPGCKYRDQADATSGAFKYLVKLNKSFEARYF
jgi:predicted phage terminase large subunit-like protein